MGMYTFMKLNFVKLFILIGLLSLTGIGIAQIKEKTDIESKANELGITTTELEGILNSALNNGAGGNPQPEAMTERFFTGQAAGDYFGSSVSDAGDVNGDGYSDIIVGADLNSAGGNSAGRAYIYYGGLSFDNIADVVITGDTAYDYFGISVSTAGDVNGDGYSDVIVGAYGNNAGGNSAGRAYIYFGGNSMDNTADVIMTGAAEYYHFGFSVSTAGDVNGDGYSDVIVGAPYNAPLSVDVGRSYIYFGGSLMDSTADVIMTGAITEDRFGESVATAGDVNGDGYNDVIVGASLNNAGGTGAGSSYIYFGGTPMDSTADVIMTGEAAGDGFGYSVSTAGDVNGDGYSDVIVGADGKNTSTGAAYIYFGGTPMDSTADVIMTGEATYDSFGYSVSTAGDVNGDGYSDVIVGAHLNSAGGFYAGRSYIYYGGTSMDNIADVIMTGEAPNNDFGYSVSTAGDVNGDGYSDVIVGAPYNSAGGTNAGRVYIYLNSLTGPDIPDEFFTGGGANDYLGYSVSTAGDVNGDGYSDVIVGAYNNNAGGIAAGRAYIYYGGTSLDSTADVTMTGVAGSYFGYSVSTAGDVNGDGYSDVIVGAPEIGEGVAYIYYGGTLMNNIADVTMIGEVTGDKFGSSVSTAGDVDGDGYSDVIVGAPYNSSVASFAGRSYIFYGDNLMNGLADVTIAGASINDFFGYSVSTAGDVNGDGYSDVIVGAYYINAGSAYIYFGGTSMDIYSDVTMTGEAAGDYFGWSVSTAGDVNGDGYSDVIVGAYYNSAGGINAGSAFIYFGGTSMDNIADVTLTGEAANDYVGYSVSTAGDVNGDGYSDVIVGAPGNASRSLLYFGGTSMDNITDVTMTGETANDYFGTSVSIAGDVNGDGYSDVIVGAYFNNAGGIAAGRAYLYLSSSPPIKPRIMSVKDIPYDQGGYVSVNFIRSGYDAKGESNIITEYIIERSKPPGVNGFYWLQVGTVQPLQNLQYSFDAVTPNDSMTNNSGTYYFRVTARTSDPNQYWRSNIMSGHSVDNLSPAAPLNFYAALIDTNVHLGWQANTEGDLKEYHIYRDVTPLSQNLTLIGTTTDTTFTDTTVTSGNIYYYVSAFDIHNNESPYSQDSVTAAISGNIKVFLEGPFLAGSMSIDLNTFNLIPPDQPYDGPPWNYPGTDSVTSVPANVVDWVLVELRSDLTTIADRRAAFIKNDGSLVDLNGVSNIKFPNAAAGDYYVVIIHRNHLSVMTAQKVTISFSPTLYDMRTDINKIHGGTNAIKDLGGGYYGMVAGDANGNGQIQNNDSETYWAVQNGQSGYKEGDYNLNGQVQNNDRETYWVPNNGRGTQVPAGTYLMPVSKIDKNTEVTK